MTITLENAGAYIGIILFTCAAIKLIVVSPIQSSIANLQATVKETSTTVSDLRERIAVNDQKIDALHVRLDDHIEATAK